MIKYYRVTYDNINYEYYDENEIDRIINLFSIVEEVDREEYYYFFFNK